MLIHYDLWVGVFNAHSLGNIRVKCTNTLRSIIALFETNTIAVHIVKCYQTFEAWSLTTSIKPFELYVVDLYKFFIKLFSSFTTASRLSTMSVNVSLIMLIMLFIEMVELKLGREYYSLISVFNDGIIHVTIEIFYLKRLNVRRFGKTGGETLKLICF